MARSSKSGRQGGAPAKPRAKRARPSPTPQVGNNADGKDSTRRVAEPREPLPNEVAPARAKSVVASTTAASTREEIVPSAASASKDRSINRTVRVAIGAIGMGVVVVAGLAATYLLAPHRAPRSATNALAAKGKGQTRASCSLATAQSFNAPIGTPSIAFRIDTARACVNDGTPYEKTPGGFSRTIPNAGDRVVSTLNISADLTSLQRRDFPLSPRESASLHAALGSVKSLKCSPSDGPATAAANRLRLATIRALSQPYVLRQPTRQITWQCSALPRRG